MKSKHTLWAVLAVLSSFATASAQTTVTWDDGGADTLWTTGLNWSNDVEPGTGDTVTIGSGFTVDYDRTTGSGTLPGGTTLNVEGTLDVQTTNVIRLGGATVNVASSGTLAGKFWDLSGGTLTFEDGAQFTANNWEQKGTNVFNFNLSASGFTALTPNSFQFGGGADFTNATYNVDMSTYTGGPGVITLLDAGSGPADAASFQTANLNVINPGSYPEAALHWNATDKSIVLVLVPKTWDGGGVDDSWATLENWNPDGVPEAWEAVTVGLNASVTDATNVFSNLEIESGATVAMGTNLNGSNSIQVDGTLDKAGAPGVLRTNGATLDVSGSLGASITFFDTNSSTINFFDGASFGNSSMPFEHKGTNTFGYTLSETGFTTLVAGLVRSGNSATWSDVTYNIDVTDYNISNGTVVTLADYSGSTMPGDFATGATVNIIAGGSGLAPTLSFDATESQLILTFGGGNDYASWATDNGIPGEPATGDFEGDGLSNFLEYALGKNPTVSDLPPGVLTGGTVTFTKGADAIANGDVDYVIEESDDLGVSDPWLPVVIQNAPNTDLTISYTLPTGQPKIFARLNVTQAP